MARTMWTQLNLHKQRQPYKLGLSKVCLVTEQQHLQISQSPDQADPAVKMLHYQQCHTLYVTAYMTRGRSVAGIFPTTPTFITEPITHPSFPTASSVQKFYSSFQNHCCARQGFQKANPQVAAFPASSEKFMHGLVRRVCANAHPAQELTGGRAN